MSNPRASTALKAGATLCGLVVIAAVAGLVTGADQQQDLALAFARPSSTHWLGCDAFGTDLGRRILAGSWHSLRVAAIVTAITMTLGLLIGTAAAIAPRPAALLLDRLIDCFLAFPGLLLAILIASIMPASDSTVIFALAATAWTARARFTRALMRKLIKLPYIEAARAGGASLSRIISRHAWPAMLGQLAVQAALSFGTVILAEASLSFIGLGGSSDNPSWGRLIAEGRDYLVEAPHLSVLPGLAFVLAVLAFNLLAEGLRNRLDQSFNKGLY